MMGLTETQIGFMVLAFIVLFAIFAISWDKRK